MKKLLSLFVLFIFMFMMVGCGKLDESWNGVYTNGSDYSVLIFTSDNQNASIAVLQRGENFQFYPIDYPNHLNVSETELTAKAGEPIKIVKDGLKIKITVDIPEKGVWEEIEGEYTKVKNAKSYSFKQF